MKPNRFFAFTWSRTISLACILTAFTFAVAIAAGDFQGVQLTPHNSEASIIFGKGATSAKPGSTRDHL